MIQKRSMFSWITSRYRGLQLVLLAVIAITVVSRVIPLEIQKRIVNQAIGGSKMDLLFYYCGIYLGAVLLAGLLKYFINMLQGYLGQKILFEMRTRIYEHVLQLPLPFFRNTPPGMVVTALTSELSAVGDFLGSALAVPVINILTLLTFAGYLIHLNPLLGLLSLIIYPVEIIIIPILQNRYNRLNQERIDVTRSLSNVISEAVAGIQEVQGHAGYPIENSKFGGFAGALFGLRLRMNFLNYGVKFANNFFQNLGPFMLFLLGGWLAMRGQLSLGALIAFLSAYEKLYDPWKELMDYYQDFQDSRVRYHRVMDYFDAEPEFVLAPADRASHELEGGIEVKELSYYVDSSIQLLDRISLELKPGEHLALVGFSGSGKSTLAMVLGQLYRYDTGHVLMDGNELRSFTKLDVSRNVGFVAQQPFVFDGTIRENLLYACRSLVMAEGAPKTKSLPGTSETLEVVGQVGLREDVLRFGLNSVLTSEKASEIAPLLIEIRASFQRQWRSEIASLVEFFDVNRFLYEGTIHGNIMFGEPQRVDFELDRIPWNREFRKILRESDLEGPLLAMGKDLAEQVVTLFEDFRQDFSISELAPISLQKLDEYSEIMQRLPGSNLSARDEGLLLQLALGYVPARHKLATVTQSLQKNIIEARRMFMQRIGRQDLDTYQFDLDVDRISAMDHVDEIEPAISFYAPNQYFFRKTVLDNIIFGRLRSTQARAMEQVQKLVVQMLETHGLLDKILEFGLDFEVGSKGDRLSGGQKQKIALVRILLKKPRIMILDEATASLDNASQLQIQRLLETQLKGKCTVVAVVHRLDTVEGYDRIAVMKNGKIEEIDTYANLMERKGIFYGLATSGKS